MTFCSISKKQTLDDAYAAPANFLEIDVINPITHGVAGKRYTDYEVRLKVSHTYTLLFTYLFTYVPTYLLTYLLHTLPSDQPACVPGEGVQCEKEIFRLRVAEK